MRDSDDGVDPFTQDYRFLGRCISASYPQLATRKRRLADAEDPGLLGQLFQYEKLTRSERTSLLEPYHYHSTPSFVYEFMHASDRFLYRHETARLLPPLQPEPVPCNLAVSGGELSSSLSPPEPPWAWMDAMAGRRNQGN
ncbi:hypothetical protein PG995_009732 [Apiospora arundinis]